MLNSMRCKKCGLTQRVAATCKACGKPSGKTVGAPAPRPIARSTAPPAPSPAPPVVTEPVTSSMTDAMRDSMADPMTDAITDSMTASPAPGVGKASASEPGARESRRLVFCGDGKTLFGIQVVNVFRTVITLGIYHFWGKVRVRAFLLSQSEFEGDRFAYHGTGKELLIGFLKGGLVFGAIMALFNAVPFLPGGLPAQIGAIVAAYAFLLILVPIAMVGARRYRLSRISWRNIRFSFRGRTKAFIAIFTGGLLLTVLTLGLYYPFWATTRQAFMVSNSHFGNHAFGFDGRGRALFVPFLLAAFLTLPTLGLSWVWFLARRQRYWWDHTSFGAARFRSTVTGGRLLRLHAGNLLLLVLTLGLGWAWVVVRRARFEFDNLTLDGRLDLATVQQEVQDSTATGEGLDLLLDMDTGLATG